MYKFSFVARFVLHHPPHHPPSNPLSMFEILRSCLPGSVGRSCTYASHKHRDMFDVAPSDEFLGPCSDASARDKINIHSRPITICRKSLSVQPVLCVPYLLFNSDVWLLIEYNLHNMHANMDIKYNIICCPWQHRSELVNAAAPMRLVTRIQGIRNSYVTDILLRILNYIEWGKQIKWENYFISHEMPYINSYWWWVILFPSCSAALRYACLAHASSLEPLMPTKPLYMIRKFSDE